MWRCEWGLHLLGYARPMVYETWRPNNPELQRLCRNNHVMIRWICGSKTEMKQPQLRCYKNLALRILCRSFAASDSDGMAMYSVPSPVSKLSQTSRFLALESKEGWWRHGLNVWKVRSISVTWLALTHKTEMHGESVFDITWYCQSHRMGHGWVDGWMGGWIYIYIGDDDDFSQVKEIYMFYFRLTTYLPIILCQADGTSQVFYTLISVSIYPFSVLILVVIVWERKNFMEIWGSGKIFNRTCTYFPNWEIISAIERN